MSSRTSRAVIDRRARRYLAASAFGAAFAANAYHPVSRKGPLSALAFSYGVLGSELPLQDIGLKAAISAFAISRGALRRPAGQAALAMTAASSVALVALSREAERSTDVFEQALVKALGDDYRKGIVDLTADDDGSKLTRRQVVLPSIYRAQRRHLISDRDVSYGEFGRRNTLDIWHKPDLATDAKAPVLIQIHGGAWVIGQKSQQATPLLARMAEHGWVCLDVNYRLSPRATWPDHIVDVKRAIAWVKENIGQYGGDPDMVVITGGSAGGHLSSLAALSPNEAAFQPGFEDVDTTVHGAVPFYGVYDFTNRDHTGRADMEGLLAKKVFKSKLADDRDTWDKASPMAWVNPQAPPFFVIHGTNDSLVPVEQARSFVSMLRAVSEQPVAFAELPRAQHAFDFMGSVRTLHSVRAVERFLASVRVRHQRGADHSIDAEPALSD